VGFAVRQVLKDGLSKNVTQPIFTDHVFCYDGCPEEEQIAANQAKAAAAAEEEA
jgi:hypothetical protein